MKKEIKLISIAVIAAFTFMSCQKCTTCKVTLSGSSLVLADDGQYCGTKQDIKDYKDGLKSSYPSPDYTINCADK
jgi:hypothetical protein